MKNEEDNFRQGLCFRCEHRAVFLETEFGPRFECKETDKSKMQCYMYKPTRPAILKRAKGDKRPRFAGWGLSSREEIVRVAEDGKDVILKMKTIGKDEAMLYWQPKGKNE